MKEDFDFGFSNVDDGLLVKSDEVKKLKQELYEANKRINLLMKNNESMYNLFHGFLSKLIKIPLKDGVMSIKWPEKDAIIQDLIFNKLRPLRVEPEEIDQ